MQRTRADDARRQQLLAFAGVFLLGLYVVPLFAPPATVTAVITPATGTWTRIFPNAPGWWVAWRLMALAAAAALLGYGESVASQAPGVAATETLPALPRPSSTYQWAALAIALVLIPLTATSAAFPHVAQLSMILMLALPAAILRFSESRADPTPRAAVPATTLVWWGIAVLLIGVWFVWRVVAAHHDARAADMVDMWKNFDFFLDAANRPHDDLAQAYEVGFANTYLLLIGLPFVGPGRLEASFAFVQTIHGAWAVLAALGVAALTRRLVGLQAMPIAVAAFLFSPFMLSMALSPTPFALLVAFAAGLLIVVCRIYAAPIEARSSDIVAFGAMAGLSSTFLHLTLWAGVAGLAILPRLWRRRPSLLDWVIAVVVGIAAVTPVVPILFNLPAISETYAERRGAGEPLLQLVMGQKHYTHREVSELWRSGERGVADVPLAAVLQPFAVPRTPVRLCGDVYFEPISAALAAVGLVACIYGRRQRTTQALLLCWLVAVFPAAIASATDRASLNRAMVLPLLLPLFSVVGVSRIARLLGWRMLSDWVSVSVAAVVVLSGSILFDIVNPRIVARTWLGLTLPALAETPSSSIMLLEPGNPPNDWLHIAEIGHFLPADPLRTRAYENGGSLLAALDGDVPIARLLFWSPSLEEQESVQTQICRCWPDATLYLFHDAAGLSRAFGARLQGEPWSPTLPPSQWAESSCRDRLTTAPSCAPLRASGHEAMAQKLADEGKLAEARASYSEAVRLDPARPVAHNGLGQMLAAQHDLDAAIAEYQEAIRLDPRLAPAHNNLAIALEGKGRLDEALEHYREAVHISPDDPRGLLNLGAVLAGRGELIEALIHLRHAVSANPGMPEAHLGLADVLVQQGQTAEAMREYGSALELARRAGRADIQTYASQRLATLEVR